MHNIISFKIEFIQNLPKEELNKRFSSMMRISKNSFFLGGGVGTPF